MPVTRASTVVFPDLATMRALDWKNDAQWRYGLHATPTSLALAQRLAAIEGGKHALLQPSGRIVAFALLMGAGCGVMYAYYATVYSTIHDVVEPSLRGTAMALYFCAMYILGASLGPIGTGLASDYFTFQAASAAGAVEPLPFGALMLAEVRSLVGESKGFDLRALEPFRAEGLHTAMYIVPTLAVVLAVVLFIASRTVRKDVATLQVWMAEASRTSRAGL